MIAIRFNKNTKEPVWFLERNSKIVSFDSEGGCEELEMPDGESWKDVLVPCSEKKFPCQDYLDITNPEKEIVELMLEELGFDMEKFMPTIKVDTVSVTAQSVTSPTGGKYIEFSAKLPRTALHSFVTMCNWIMIQIENELSN